MSGPVITITEVTDENRDAILERMTGMTRWEASRCEYDPVRNEPALTCGGGCQNEATISLGSRASMSWHLCASCAALPAFKRFKSRRPLPSLYPA